MTIPSSRQLLTLALFVCIAAAAIRLALVLRPSPPEQRSPNNTVPVATRFKLELHSEFLAQAVPKPRISGHYPCVYVSMDEDALTPRVGQCGMSSGLFSSPVDRFEIDLRYGSFILRQTDLFLRDEFPVPFTRTYNSSDWFYGSHVRAFGSNSNHTYDIAPAGSRNPYSYQGIALEDANFVYFDRISAGTSYADAVFRHSETSSLFYKAFTWWNGSGWTTKLADGTKIYFPESYNAQKIADGAPSEVVDPVGHRLILHRDADRNLQEIRTPHDHTITLTYNDQGRIMRAEDDASHWTIYLYNADGMLISATSSSGKARHYEYDGDKMTLIRDEKGNTLLENTYRSGIVVGQQFAGGQVYLYGYRWASDGNYAETALVRSPDGTIQEIPTGKSVPNYVRGIHP